MKLFWLRSLLSVHGAALFAGMTLGSCSSDKGPKYPDVNSFCNGRAEAECSGEVIRACAAADAAHCIAKRQAACVSLAPTGTTYNSNVAEGCINAVSAAYSDARVTLEENVATNEACIRIFDGPGAANATCTRDIDCRVSAEMRCVLGGGLSTGTCQVPERVQGGGSCASSNQLCVDGFHCGTTKHCDVNSQVAESCDATLPCAETARCAATGMCEKKFDDGTACMTDTECLHGICARGTGAAAGLCVSQVTLAPNEPFCIDAR